jgi:hypothetical protein
MLNWTLEKLSLRQYGRDTARYTAASDDGLQPFVIRVRVTKGKCFFVLSQGAQHYTTMRSLERAKAVAQKIHNRRSGSNASVLGSGR